jgi:hypothetical protein
MAALVCLLASLTFARMACVSVTPLVGTIPPFPPEYGGPGVPVGLPHVGQDGLRVCDAPGGVPVRQEEYHGLDSLL